MTYDFDAMREELDSTRRVTNLAKADRDVARIHALATVALAESVAQLVVQQTPAYIDPAYTKAYTEAKLSKSLSTPLVDPEPERAPDPAERDWRMGDVVTIPGNVADEFHVENVGIDQGGTFLAVIGENGEEAKVWAEHATFIRHDAAEALDADFAEAANAGRKSDAFAAAKAKTKKAGK